MSLLCLTDGREATYLPSLVQHIKPLSTMKTLVQVHLEKFDHKAWDSWSSMPWEVIWSMKPREVKRCLRRPILDFRNSAFPTISQCLTSGWHSKWEKTEDMGAPTQQVIRNCSPHGIKYQWWASGKVRPVGTKRQNLGVGTSPHSGQQTSHTNLSRIHQHKEEQNWLPLWEHEQISLPQISQLS